MDIAERFFNISEIAAMKAAPENERRRIIFSILGEERSHYQSKWARFVAAIIVICREPRAQPGSGDCR